MSSCYTSYTSTHFYKGSSQMGTLEYLFISNGINDSGTVINSSLMIINSSLSIRAILTIVGSIPISSHNVHYLVSSWLSVSEHLFPTPPTSQTVAGDAESGYRPSGVRTSCRHPSQPHLGLLGLCYLYPEAPGEAPTH